MQVQFMTQRLFLVEEYECQETGRHIVPEDELREYIIEWVFDGQLPASMSTNELIEQANCKHGYFLHITEL